MYVCVSRHMCVEINVYLIILLENNTVKLNLHFIINLASVVAHVDK